MVLAVSAWVILTDSLSTNRRKFSSSLSLWLLIKPLCPRLLSYFAVAPVAQSSPIQNLMLTSCISHGGCPGHHSYHATSSFHLEEQVELGSFSVFADCVTFYFKWKCVTFLFFSSAWRTRDNSPPPPSPPTPVQFPF